MPAQMPQAGALRGMRHARGIRDRQRVQLGAEHHGRAGLAAVVNGGHAMPAQTRHQPVGCSAAQRIGDKGGGAGLCARKFWLAVQGVAQGDQVVFHAQGIGQKRCSVQWA